MAIGDGPSAPVSRLGGRDPDAVGVEMVSPAQLVHPFEPAHQIPVAVLHDHPDVRGQSAERPQVGVVHVGVGEQNEIERG